MFEVHSDAPTDRRLNLTEAPVRGAGVPDEHSGLQKIGHRSSLSRHALPEQENPTVSLDVPADPTPMHGLSANDADLGALLCSRICHDLISPVGAVGNGVELMQEIAPEMSEEMGLIGDSARAAAAVLEFHRIAFGAAAAGERIGVSRLRRIAGARFARERAALDWPEAETGAQASRAAGRLLFDMLLVCAGALPRGGDLRVRARFGASGAADLEVIAQSDALRMTDAARAWLDGTAAAQTPTAGEVHLPVTRLNAQACGAALTTTIGDAEVRLKAHVPSDGRD